MIRTLMDHDDLFGKYKIHGWSNENFLITQIEFIKSNVSTFAAIGL